MTLVAPRRAEATASSGAAVRNRFQQQINAHLLRIIELLYVYFVLNSQCMLRWTGMTLLSSSQVSGIAGQGRMPE